MATLTVGTNSWVTIAESNTYLDEKWGASAWAGLSDPNKTQLLITAYRWINSDDRYEIAASETNDNVKYAQIETAWYVYNRNTEINDRMALQAQGVKEFEVSKFQETYGKGTRLPDFVEGLLDGWESYTVLATVERTLD